VLAEFRVLGPVEVAVEGCPVPIPAAKPRALLVLLLLERNRVVSVDTLIDELWGEEPPETATKALQGYISQLRKALGAERVATKPPGYALRVEEGELDLDRFEHLAREGRERLAGGDARAAADRLREALELWRGPALTEFSEPFAAAAAARLEDARVAALEGRIDADLALGRHAELVPELELLVAAEPYRERLRGLSMLALYRAGRQADALEVYRQTRETLVDELGIEPSRELQELEQAILRHDESLDVGQRPPLPAAVAAEAPGRARSSRRLPLLVGAALAIAAAAAIAAALALTGGGSSGKPDLRSFVVKVENFLIQSRDGRREISQALAGTLHCTLSPRRAADRLDSVARNRQSLLDQVAALAVPSDEDALRASDRLQRALRASITADWHYRDWLGGRSRCGAAPASAELRAAQRSDREASREKRAFVDAFNPLARRFGQEVWTAGEF
jgi:DNA-binding SARP family transcriptional activator